MFEAGVYVVVGVAADVEIAWNLFDGEIAF